MGFFETLKHKSAAKKAGLTYEQYLEFLAMAAEKGYSLDDYRMHLKAVESSMTDEQYREYIRDFSTLQPEECLHFYKARSEGLSVKAYDVYLAEYQQFMSAAQYGDYLKVGESDMSIEEYIAYLKNHPQSNADALELYITTQKAQKLNMTLPQYREYAAKYSSSLSAEQYLMFCDARTIGLSLEQFGEYWRSYRDQYTLERYYQYCQAQKENLSLNQYDEWKKDYSSLPVARFHALLEARLLNMSLIQYDEYLAGFSSKMSAEQFLVYCKARVIGLSLEQFNEYWCQYRNVYSLERYSQYCIARTENLSLDQYDEWQAEFSSLSATRFRNLLEARKQNMTLEAYEELQSAHLLGLTVEQYREKKLANSLGIRVEDLPFYRACQENQEKGKNFTVVTSWDEVKIANKLRIKKIILAAEQFKALPYQAFAGCDAFEEIILPWGIQEIGEYAFLNCSALETIAIPGSVSMIPKDVFDGCNALRAIELLSGIETVDITGWSDLPSLKSVVSTPTIKDFLVQDIPERTYIHKDTSRYSIGLTITATSEEQKNARTVIMEKGYSDIWITAKLTGFVNVENIIIHCDYVDKLEIENCPNVKVIIVDGCIKRYVDHYKNGNIKKISTYTYDIDIPNNQQGLKFFLVKDHLERIGGGLNCPKLSWVHLPAGTQTVKIDTPSLIALSTSATDVPKSILTVLRNSEDTLADTVAPMRVCCRYANKKTAFVHYITDEALPNEIKKANEIEIMEGTTAIPQLLFRDCTMTVVKLPASLNSIGKKAFSGCKALKTVYLKNCPEHVGADIFENCPIDTVHGMDPMKARTKLGAFTVELSGVRELDFSGIKSVIPPMYFQGSDVEEIIIPKRVKEIGSYAFANSQKLTRIVFKGCPEIIAADAFEGCTQVEEIIWGACTHFCIAGKTGFPNIKQFSIPEGVTEIPDNCFKNWGIQDITIPHTVASIGKKAFEGCPISTINGENGILRLTENCQIASNAFAKCSFQTIVLDVSKPDKFIEIAENVGATEIFVRDTVGINSFNRILSIPNLASVSCIKTDESILVSTDELQAMPATLRSLELPRSVGKLYFTIFDDCEELTTLTIPESVAQVLFEVELANLKLQEITVPADMYHVILKEWINPDTQVTLLGEAHPEKYVVTAIGEDAHLPELDKKDHLLIQKLIIPEQCKSIAEAAFENLANLRSVEIRAPIQRVGAKAFCGCVHLEQIVLPDSVDSIGEAAFLGCTSLAQVQLPQALTKVEAKVFCKCAELRNIDLPTTVAMIGESAFEGCEWLDALAIPDQSRELGAFAFAGSGLKKVHISDGIKRLHKGIFKDCTQLTTVTGMQNVGYVDEDAFSGSAVVDLVFSEEIFSINNAFKECKALERIFVPVNIAKFCVDLTACTSMRDLYLPQQIDEFSCETSFSNCITIHARRGSAWRQKVRVQEVDYIKNNEYDEAIRNELEKAGLHRSTEPEMQMPAIQTAKRQPAGRVSGTPHKRASWNIRSSATASEEVFTTGPSTVDELLEKLQTNTDERSYVIESVDCGLFTAPVATSVEKANIYVSEETKGIANNIFSITLKCREKMFPDMLCVVLVDRNGTPVSDLKKVCSIQSGCESIDVQLQLNTGTANGDYYLMALSQATSDSDILCADKCTVDVAFAVDVDFGF